MCCCCLGRESIGSIDQSKLDDGNNLLVFSALLLVQTHLLILLFVDSGTRNIRGGCVAQATARHCLAAWSRRYLISSILERNWGSRLVLPSRNWEPRRGRGPVYISSIGSPVLGSAVLGSCFCFRSCLGTANSASVATAHFTPLEPLHF